MPSLEEAMRQSEDGIEQLDDGLITPVNDILMINPETREIVIPETEKLFGVKFDADVERKHFKCPKIVGDNIDLSQHKIYVVYQIVDEKGNVLPETSNPKVYWCEDMQTDEMGDYITFSWQLSGNVFESSGIVSFKVIAVCTNTETGELKTRWNTIPAYGTVKMTLSNGEEIVKQYADVITQLLQRMDEVEAIATPAVGIGLHANANLIFNRCNFENKGETSYMPNDGYRNISNYGAVFCHTDTKDGIQNQCVTFDTCSGITKYGSGLWLAKAGRYNGGMIVKAFRNTFNRIFEAGGKVNLEDGIELYFASFGNNSDALNA